MYFYWIQSYLTTLLNVLPQCTNYIYFFLPQSIAQVDFSMLKSQLEDERYHVERLEEQINDLTELHQNEVTNLKQVNKSLQSDYK